MATTDFVVKNGLVVNEDALIRDTTNSISTSSGALVVNGGVGIANALYVGGTANLQGDLTLTGDLAVNGGDITTSQSSFNFVNSATTIGIANTGTTARAINIATAATGGASTLTFGGAVSGNTLEINSVAGGTINLSSDVTTGAVNLYTGLSTGTMTVGSAAAGRLAVAFNQSSVSTSTGALTVAGGAGITENLWVGGYLNVDNLRFENNTISSTNTDGNIDITPNGAGDVNINSDTLKIGEVTNADGTITTVGTGDLILNTNDGTNSGQIRIFDGANGTISIQTNGTGEVVINDAGQAADFRVEGDADTNLIFADASADRVGIGANDPVSKLDVRTGYITSGTVSSVSGSKILAGNYSNGHIATWGGDFSSGGPVMGYGVWPSTSTTGSFVSSSGIAIARGAYHINGNTHVWYQGAAQTVAVDSAVTTTEVMRAFAGSLVVTGSTAGANLVLRGGPIASSEGAQITLGYGNNTASTITGQANNSWNIDVADGAANNDLRIFRQDNSGATQIALQITESSGAVTLPVREIIQGNLAAWDTTTPGTGTGGLHLGAASATADVGPAITFGARDSGSGATAQAGIYVTSGSGFGTRMYLATTDAYASGSKVAVSVGETGVVSIVRSTAADNTTTGSLVVSGGVGVGGNLYTGGNMYITNTGPVLVLRDTNSTGAEQIGYLSFQDNTATERAWVGYGTTGNDIFNIQNTYSGGFTFNGNTVWHAGNDGSGSGLDADTLDGRHLDTLVASLRANRNITGGGTITFDSSGNLLWSARFIVISNGRGTHFSTNGYFDIECPTSGTITGVGGAVDVTATAAGIPIGTWHALYYIMPVGSNNSSLAANFRVATYTSDLVIPDTWVLLAVRNSDTGQGIYLHNGYRLELGQSINTTVYDAKFAENADTVDGLNPTSANTVSTIVARDSSGNFSAGTITASLNGNATTASSTPNPTFSGDSVDKDDITTRTESGFYQTSTATTLEGWPTTTDTWQHLISCTHSNDSNHYAMQLAAPFFTQDLYYRSTNGDGTQSWNKIWHSNSADHTMPNYRVDTAERYPLGHYTGGGCVFEIDPTWSQTQLQTYFNSNSVTWVNDSTAPGGYAISVVGAINVGGQYGSGFPYIPVEQNDTFIMEVWIKDVSGTNTHYMGSIDYDHNFTNLGGNPGSFGYWVMSNTAPGSSWTKYVGVISGFDANATGKFELGTKYWTPQALFNYSGGGTSYISGWRVFRASSVTYGTSSISAAGSTQGTATAITFDITTISGGTGGVRLPAVTGKRIMIRNNTGSTINVYPNAGAQIETLGNNVAYAMLTSTTVELVSFSATQWYFPGAVAT